MRGNTRDQGSDADRRGHRRHPVGAHGSSRRRIAGRRQVARRTRVLSRRPRDWQSGRMLARSERVDPVSGSRRPRAGERWPG